MSAAASPVSTVPSGSPLSYLNAERGLASWLTTVDHKRIGLMYLVSTLFFFLLAGLMALALRVEVTVHAGSLQAIYLKHDACARFDTDVTEAEECAGQCSMRWLTTFNPITLEPSLATSAQGNPTRSMPGTSPKNE